MKEFCLPGTLIELIALCSGGYSILLRELPSTALKRRHHVLDGSALNAFAEGFLFAVPDAYPEQHGTTVNFVFFKKIAENGDGNSSRIWITLSTLVVLGKLPAIITEMTTVTKEIKTIIIRNEIIVIGLKKLMEVVILIRKWSDEW